MISQPWQNFGEKNHEKSGNPYGRKSGNPYGRKSGNSYGRKSGNPYGGLFQLKEMTVVTYNSWESWPMSAVKIFGGHPPSRGSQKNFDLGGRRGKGLGDWQMLLPTGLAP